MVNLITPPNYQVMYARCIDDSLPAFEPSEWIELGRIYTIKHLAESLTTSEGFALTLTDTEGREIHPSDSHWSFASDRFELFSVFLN